MIITENKEKVKRKAVNLVNSLESKLSKPQRKFVLEMIMGMVMTGSCNITAIAGALREKTEIRHTLKRLQRMLNTDEILGVSNDLAIRESLNRIDEKTIIALDGGDITHQYGKCFEKSAFVRDGSTKSIKNGYYLNQISGYDPDSRATFPIMLDIYSSLEKGFKSENTESLNLIDQLSDKIGSKGLWVMDRGYDNGTIIHHLLKKKLHFMIRMMSTRNIIYRNKSININTVAKSVNRRYIYNKNCRFGSAKVRIKLQRKLYEVTLIVFKDKKRKKPIVFLANDWIKSKKEMKRRIRGYFHRWGVEESYRFEKQGFGIEKATTRKFKRIKTLTGLTLLSWILLLKINDDKKLKEIVCRKAKREKIKLKKRPKFIYYRLLSGIKEMFSDCKELFRFRLSFKKKKKIIKDIGKKYPLLNHMLSINDFIEVIA